MKFLTIAIRTPGWVCQWVRERAWAGDSSCVCDLPWHSCKFESFTCHSVAVSCWFLALCKCYKCVIWYQLIKITDVQEIVNRKWKMRVLWENRKSQRICCRFCIASGAQTFFTPLATDGHSSGWLQIKTPSIAYHSDAVQGSLFERETSGVKMTVCYVSLSPSERDTDFMLQ